MVALFMPDEVEEVSAKHAFKEECIKLLILRSLGVIVSFKVEEIIYIENLTLHLLLHNFPRNIERPEFIE